MNVSPADPIPRRSGPSVSGNTFTGPTAFMVGDHNIQHNTFSFQVSAADPVDAAAGGLTRAVWAQWREEARARGLFAPALIAVRWKADETYSDHLRLTGSRAEGSGESMDAFADAFLALRQRRLVILGEAGTGKTTLAVMLMITLVRRLSPGDPIPVLLSLGSWDPASTHLDTWLERQLRQDYPALAPAALAALISTQRILPVLDGLDELAPEQQPEALRALNRALADGGPLILTSRSGAYRAAVRETDVLRLAAVVEAETMTAEAVAGYLANCATRLHLARWQPVIDELRANPAGPLARGLCTPLMMWLIRMAYQPGDSSPAELTDSARFPDPASVEQHLLGALVPSAFPSFPQPLTAGHVQPRQWPADKAGLWLGSLARHLVREQSEDLKWWTIPVLAGRGYEKRLNFSRWMCALAGYLLAVVLLFPTIGDVAGIAVALSAGSLVYCTGMRVQSIERSFSPRERPGARRPLQALGDVGCLVSPLCLLVGFAVFSVFEVTNPNGLGPDLLTLAAVIASFGLALVVSSSLLRLLVTSDQASTPRRSLATGRARAYALATALTLMLAPLLFIPAIVGSLFYFGPKHSDYNGSPWPEIQVSLIMACFMMLLLLSRSSWGLYLTARLSLAMHGRVPWRLGAFIADAHRRGVLRQVGSVYQFRHSKLRDRLAEQDGGPPPA
jgi:hypothetical protein